MRLIVFVVAVLALARIASAQTCWSGCGMQKRACLQTARAAKLACKLDCRTTASDLRTCMFGCVSDFRTARAACATDRDTCATQCVPPPGMGDGCLLGCGQALAGCAHDVIDTARNCVVGCRDAASPLACLHDCADGAEAGATQCANDFQTCLTGCGVTTSTTLPTHFCGPDPDTHECGGFCPFGLTCAPPPPNSLIMLACICRRPASPSGAFLD